MSGGPDGKARDAFARAIAHADWGSIRAKVVKRLRGAQRADVDDLLAKVTEQCLRGKRVWNEQVELGVFFSQAVRSLRWSDTKQNASRNAAEKELVDESPTLAVSPEAERLQNDRLARLRAWVGARIEGDAELKALWRVYLDGAEKPSEQAEALGWSRERLDAVKHRLARRLARGWRQRETRRDLESDLRPRR